MIDPPKRHLPSSDAAIRVVAAVIARGKHYFLAKRPSGKHLADYWEFPGGKVELGESDEQALRRELQEELMVAPTSFQFLAQSEHDYGDKRVLIVAYLVTIDGQEPSCTEHSEGRWLAADEIRCYQIPPADAFVIDLL